MIRPRDEDDDDVRAVDGRVWLVECDGDGCTETLGNGYSLELFALLVATQQGWRIRRMRKFTGYTQELLCRTCQQRRGPEL